MARPRGPASTPLRPVPFGFGELIWFDSQSAMIDPIIYCPVLGWPTPRTWLLLRPTPVRLGLGLTLILRYGLWSMPFRAFGHLCYELRRSATGFLVRLCIWKYLSVCGRLWWFSGRRMWFSTVVPLVPLLLGCFGKFALVPRLCQWFYLGFLC